MSADEFLRLVTQLVMLVIFVIVVVDAVRRPRRATIDIALYFGAIAGIVVIGDVQRWLPAAAELNVLTDTALILLVALPYVLLRLVDGLEPQPRRLRIAAAAVTALLVASIVVIADLPDGLLVAIAVWFVVLGGYDAFAFMTGSRRARGVTGRRMLAAAIGAGLLAGTIALAVIAGLVSILEEPLTVIYRLTALATAVAFFVAFATPSFLRRAWQEPELRSFLERAARLPRLGTTQAIVEQLELGAATATGAPHAVIGLWDSEREVLVYRGPDGVSREYRGDAGVAGQAFSEQRPLFVADAPRHDPEHARGYERAGARAVLAAPIRAGDKRLGVLMVYAPRAPIFADDDLRLVQLLADQAAVILESRALIDEASRVRAREEATRLKDDFLSAAAHDLRTPLTTILIHAQMLQRRLEKDPDAPAEAHRITTLLTEAMRLRTLVSDYLDAARAERGELVNTRAAVDLADLARQSCERYATGRHRCRHAGDESVIGTFDPDRIRQLLDNLIGNAIKYSPDGGDVEVRTWVDGDLARLTVTDQGIGIPTHDLPHLFDRFHRASNVDDRRFQGLGLGLYICRGIVEQHGGRLWATSQVGGGSTFHVELPLQPRSLGPPEPVETATRRLEHDIPPTAAEAGAGG